MKMGTGCQKAILFLMVIGLVTSSCEKLDIVREIALATKRVEIISSTSVRVTGEIVDDGEGIEDYGFVFSSTNSTPTITGADFVESAGQPEPGEFVQVIGNLDPRIKYYVRAFATPDGTNYRYSDPITFTIQDVWTMKSSFGGAARANAVAFTVNGKGYMGMGNNTTEQLFDFWEYDLEMDSWTQKADFPSGTSVTNFSVATPTWAILGLEGTQETWAYDFDGNAWIQKADFPGVPRYMGFCFQLLENIYFGGGVILDPDRSYPLDVWEYDPQDDVWTRKADFPSAGREHAASFNIGNYGFVGMGFSRDESDNPTYHFDFWRFDPLDDSGGIDTRGNPLGLWIQRADAPGATRFIGYTIDSKGFVFSIDRFLIYDPVSNSWSVTKPFNGIGRVNAAGFALNGRAFVGTGVYDYGEGNWVVVNDFWEYVPPVFE
jgi:N-acetylneuraminic acid mutarotase